MILTMYYVVDYIVFTSVFMTVSIWTLSNMIVGRELGGIKARKPWLGSKWKARLEQDAVIMVQLY